MGLDKTIAAGLIDFEDRAPLEWLYLNSLPTDEIFAYEQFFGFDGVKRLGFNLPFNCFDEITIEDNSEYTLIRAKDGWIRKKYKNKPTVQDIKAPLHNFDDWYVLKDRAETEISRFFSRDSMLANYGRYREDHERGEYTIRVSICGFFWASKNIFSPITTPLS